MAALLEFHKITDARDRFKDLYDSAQEHLPAVVQRENDAAVAVVRRDDLVRALAALCPLEPKVRFAGDGMVSMWLDDVPVHAQGSTFDEAAQELITALRDYADLWATDLRRYPNHEDAWGVVNLVLLATDEQLWSHLFDSEP